MNFIQLLHNFSLGNDCDDVKCKVFPLASHFEWSIEKNWEPNNEKIWRIQSKESIRFGGTECYKEQHFFYPEPEFWWRTTFIPTRTESAFIWLQKKIECVCYDEKSEEMEKNHSSKSNEWMGKMFVCKLKSAHSKSSIAKQTSNQIIYICVFRSKV